MLAQRWADVVAGRHGLLADRRRTVRAEVGAWFPVHAPTLAPRTAESYRMVLDRHLLPFFGDTPLVAVTTEQIRAYRAAQLAADHPLSAASINYHIVVLSMMLKNATLAGRLARNPAQGLKPLPRRVHREDQMQILTPDQVRAFLEAAAPALRPLLTTAVLTGLRLGELLGLRWEDVDLDEGVIQVRRSLGRIKTADGYELVDGPTKSKKPRRVEMGREVIGALRPSQAGSPAAECSTGTPGRTMPRRR